MNFDVSSWAGLLHQECYCWGADIRRAQGNLLIESGFTRSKHPDDPKRSSQYTKCLSSGEMVQLFAFGVRWFSGGTQGVFINRYRFLPCIVERTSPSEFWRIEQSECLEQPRSEERLQAQVAASDLFCWIASYEDSVLASLGASYRRFSLDGFDETMLDVIDVPSKWREIADRFARTSPSQLWAALEAHALEHAS